MAQQLLASRNILLSTIALLTLSVPFSQPPTIAPQNARSLHAQFTPPTPPDPGSPSGREQGGGAREQNSTQFGSRLV